MKVIILAGGFGTRLSEKTNIVPKPMIEIGGQPLLWHLMNGFASHNYKDFIIALGYRSEVIKKYFLHFSELHSNLVINLSKGSVETEKNHIEDWKINLIDTGALTMTGGRLLRLKDKVNGRFIFTYGDGLSNIDINKLVDFHCSHGKLVTVTAVKPASRFGLLRINGNKKVINFAEKPDYNNDLINGGFFVLEPKVFDYIDNDDTSWEREPCERLVRDGEMMAYHHTGFWQCVDTLHELRHLQHLWDSGNADWKTWT